MAGDASGSKYTRSSLPSVSVPLAPCSLSTALREFTPWGEFYNFFPFPVSVPLPHPLSFLCYILLPLPVLRRLPFPLPILHSLPFPSSYLTTLRVLLTLAVIIVIAIASMAPLNARRAGIRPVLIIIILLDYLIPIQWSNGQEVAWFVLPAAWRLNLCPEIIATIAR